MSEMIKDLLKNWKTTSAGLTMIIGSVVHLVFAVKGGTANEMVWTVSLTAIVGGLGLVFAGDSSVSAAASGRNAAAVDRINQEGASPSAAPAQEIKPPTP
jgi:hypothetical protein